MPVYRGTNDAIEGERIACQYRKISPQVSVSATHRHRRFRTSLYDAYCVIIKPMRAI